MNATKMSLFKESAPMNRSLKILNLQEEISELRQPLKILCNGMLG